MININRESVVCHDRLQVDTLAKVTRNISQNLTAVVLLIKIGNLASHDLWHDEGAWRLKAWQV